MAGRLILIAHAETDAIRHGRFGAEDGLNERGRRATAAGAADLPAVDAVVASPARAAIETAAALGLQIRVEPVLRDLDVGTWAGRSIRDIAAEEPDVFGAWRTDPMFAGHGGEPIAGLVGRIGEWLAIQRSREGGMAAITHPTVCRAAVVAVLQAPFAAIWSVDVGALGHVVLTSDGRRWSLRAIRAASCGG